MVYTLLSICKRETITRPKIILLAQAMAQAVAQAVA